jgi:hypothetical protein
MRERGLKVFTSCNCSYDFMIKRFTANHQFIDSNESEMIADFFLFLPSLSIMSIKILCAHKTTNSDDDIAFGTC